MADEPRVRTRLPELVNGLTEVSQLGIFPLGRHGNLLQPLGHVGQGLLESLHHLGVGRQLGRQTQHLELTSEFVRQVNKYINRPAILWREQRGHNFIA